MTKIKCGDKLDNIGWVLVTSEGSLANTDVFHSREDARLEREWAEQIGNWKICKLSAVVSK